MFLISVHEGNVKYMHAIWNTPIFDFIAVNLMLSNT